MGSWANMLRVMMVVCAGWTLAGGGNCVAQMDAGAVPDAARKAVAQRQEVLEAVRERLMRGDRLFAERDFAGAHGEYRAAFRAAPSFAVGQPVQEESFRKYQMAARGYADRLAQTGKVEEGKRVIQDVYKDARDAGVAPRWVEEETKRLLADLQDPAVYNPALTEDMVDRVGLVEKALVTGHGAYRIGDFDEATRQFAMVLGWDPANQAARKGMEMVEDHLSTHYGKAAYDHTRARMLNEVAKSWESPVPRFGLADGMPGEEMRAGRPAEAGSVQEKLRSLILPEVEFAETPLREALAFLANRSRQIDPTGVGVNLVLRTKDETAGNRPVTLSMRGAPLGTVIDYVGRMVGMDNRIDGFAVVLVPAGDLSGTEMILKTFRVPPGFLSEGALVNMEDPFAGAGGAFGGGGGDVGVQTLQPKIGAKEYLEKNGVSFLPGSAAQFNADTSTLIVRNTQDQLDLVEAMVESSFGNVAKMLRISVKAVEIAEEDLEEIGFDWLMGAFGMTDRIQMGGGSYGNVTGGGIGDFPVLGPGGVPIPNMPLTGGLRSGDFANPPDAIDSLLARGVQGVTSGTARAPGVISMTGMLTNPQFQVVLRAVSQKKGTDGLLSSNVVVRSGQVATVKNVREFIYPTEWSPPEVPNSLGGNQNPGGGVIPLPPIVGDNGILGSGAAPVSPSNPEAFEMREVGGRMQVEGIIGPDGVTVQLTMEPEIVEFDGFVNYGGIANGIQYLALMPIFQVKRTAVTADVYDGHTVVIAGLLREQAERVNDKVPGLGDLPMMGSLFRMKSERVRKQALLFFVTPTIIDPAGAPVRNFVEEEVLGNTGRNP